MKDYSVTYYVGDMLHSHLIEAISETQAKQKIRDNSYHPELIKIVKVERFIPEWN